jgi:hypothetical protein
VCGWSRGKRLDGFSKTGALTGRDFQVEGIEINEFSEKQDAVNKFTRGRGGDHTSSHPVRPRFFHGERVADADADSFPESDGDTVTESDSQPVAESDGIA